MTITVLIVGGAVVLVSALLLGFMFIKSNQVKLTGKTDSKPEWMRSTPPEETMKATRAEGVGVALYGKNEGEHFAAPFAEQIEDILRAKLEGDPALKSFRVDFGTARDGSLEIWVNGDKFDSVDALPDEKLKQAFKDSVSEWDGKK